MSADEVPTPGGPVGPPASPGFWLIQAAQRWKLEFTRDAAPLGLSYTQFQLLASIGWLEFLGEEPTQQRVADLACTDRMMTSKVLAALEARGLVARRPDGRAKLPHLTARGRHLTAQATALARGVDTRIFGADRDIRDRLRALATTNVER